MVESKMSRSTFLFVYSKKGHFLDVGICRSIFCCISVYGVTVLINQRSFSIVFLAHCLETFQYYFCIEFSYMARAQVCLEKGLSVTEQAMVLLIDCWSVHKSQEFRTWLKEMYPLVKLSYVPAGCTGKAQPADVIQQKPLKAGIKHGFDLWTSRQVAKQIWDEVPPNEIKLDFRMGVLREAIVDWCDESFNELRHV